MQRNSTLDPFCLCFVQQCSFDQCWALRKLAHGLVCVLESFKDTQLVTQTFTLMQFQCCGSCNAVTPREQGFPVIVENP